LLFSRPTSPHSAKPNPHGHCHAEPAPQPLCLARSSDVWARSSFLPPFERNIVTNRPSPPGSEQQGFGERPRTSGYKWEATQLFRLSIVHRAPSCVEGETERDGEVRCAAAIMGGCLHHPLGPSIGSGGLALCWRTFPWHHRADWVTYSDRIAHRRIKPAAVRPTRVGNVIRVASAGEYSIFVSASVFSLRSTLQMGKTGA
jgi:hypothetical protein